MRVWMLADSFGLVLSPFLLYDYSESLDILRRASLGHGDGDSAVSQGRCEG